jgi:serpin B
VTPPQVEKDTGFSNIVLIDYLKAQGAESAFTSDADFSLMSDEMKLMITDIIQKTKIKVDETGIEAAAATAIMMTEGAFLENPEEPKEFTADEPFKYMILTSGENPELLFYGQIVE